MCAGRVATGCNRTHNYNLHSSSSGGSAPEAPRQHCTLVFGCGTVYRNLIPIQHMCLAHHQLNCKAGQGGGMEPVLSGRLLKPW